MMGLQRDMKSPERVKRDISVNSSYRVTCNNSVHFIWICSIRRCGNFGKKIRPVMKKFYRKSTIWWGEGVRVKTPQSRLFPSIPAQLFSHPSTIKMICAHLIGMWKKGTTPFHALGVHPSQISVLRFPARPIFLFLLSWGAPRPISWSAQCTSVTGVAPHWK